MALVPRGRRTTEGYFQSALCACATADAAAHAATLATFGLLGSVVQSTDLAVAFTSRRATPAAPTPSASGSPQLS